MEKLKAAIGRVISNPALWVGGIYLLFPVDVVPDAIPAIGCADDLLVFALGELLRELGNKGR